MSDLDHEMLPSICFRRLIEGCHRIVDGLDVRHAAGLTKDDPIDEAQGHALALAYVEMAHLAAMDDYGALGPVYDALEVANAAQQARAALRYDRR